MAKSQIKIMINSRTVKIFCNLILKINQLVVDSLFTALIILCSPREFKVKFIGLVLKLN